MSKESTGMCSKVDRLGRFIIPKKLRIKYNFALDSLVELYVNENQEIVVERFALTCSLCGSGLDVQRLSGRAYCTDCIQTINQYPTEE